MISEEEYFKELEKVITGESVCPDISCLVSLPFNNQKTCECFLKYNHNYFDGGGYCPCYVFREKGSVAVAKGRLSLYLKRKGAKP